MPSFTTLKEVEIARNVAAPTSLNSVFDSVFRMLIKLWRPVFIFLISVFACTLAEAVSIGDRVQYFITGSTDPLNVRQCAGTNSTLCPVTATVPPKVSYGTIISGPTDKDGYTWYKITWDSGTSGYSVQNWLRATFSDSDTYAIGDRIIVNGTEKNIRSCANISCSVVGSVANKSTGTIRSLATLNGAFYWYNVSWDSGLTGYSTSGYFEYSPTSAPSDSANGSGTGSSNGSSNGSSGGSQGTGSSSGTAVGPDLSGIGFKSTQLRVGDTLALTGTLSYTQGFWSVTVMVPDTTGGRTPLSVQLNNAKTVPLDSSTYSMPITSGDFPNTGNYDLTIDVLAADGTNPKKKVTVTILPPAVVIAVDKTAPVISSASIPSSVSVNTAIGLTGTATDETDLQSVSVITLSPNGSSDIKNLSLIRSTKSVDLSAYSFVPTQVGTYTLAVKATDTSGNSTTQKLTLTVKADNSAAIKKLQDQKAANDAKLKELKDGFTAANTALTNATAAKSTAQKDYLTATNQYSTQASSLSPTAPNTSANRASLPNCALEAMPSDFPMDSGTSYQASQKCVSRNDTKVYVLSGFTPAYSGQMCNAQPNRSFLYPAAVVYLGPNGTSHLKVAENLDQALFWISLYDTASKSNLDAAIADAQKVAAFVHPSQAQITEAKSKYDLIVSQIRDYIDEGVYAIPAITDSEADGLKALLSVAVSSIPWVQEIKTAVELCAGEDIITGEAVSFGADTVLTFIVPGGKILRKFELFAKTAPRVAKVIQDGGGIVKFARVTIQVNRKIGLKAEELLLQSSDFLVRTRISPVATLQRECFYRYPSGTCRYIDLLDRSVDKIVKAVESKTGKVPWNASTRKQLEADLSALQRGDIHELTWVSTKSCTTGESGFAPEFLARVSEISKSLPTGRKVTLLPPPTSPIEDALLAFCKTLQ